MGSRRFPVFRQHDSMQCGVCCLQMMCAYFGKRFSLQALSQRCVPTAEGVSLYALCQVAEQLGLQTAYGKVSLEELQAVRRPGILHWNQNHFVVLYRIRRRRYYLADPGKGRVTLKEAEFKKHWLSTHSQGQEKGIALFLQPTPAFQAQPESPQGEKRSFRFLFGYIRQYRRYFGQILLGLLLGCVLQLIFPFLTQAIVDVGIREQDIGFVYLILLGELMLVGSRTAVDFIRRWILLHISMRINISLVSDFFIKLLKLPMAFFDTKLTGDLLQRMNDHQRVQQFLTTQTLNVTFSLLTFAVFGAVLWGYDTRIFLIFLAGSLCYGGWISLFLKQRKQIDYLYFEKQAKNNNQTYQFITTMQEIKLQDCEQRRRWEWEDVQAELFETNQKSLKLQQAQQAGSIFINELKNIVITVVAATAVIEGQMTLGMMLAVQYIIGQLNSPIEQLMQFIYSLQDVSISLERINEIHEMENEEKQPQALTAYTGTDRSLRLRHVDFKYDPYALQKTLNDVDFLIPAGRVTAIVGASGSGKTTLVKLLLGYYPALSGEISIGGTPIGQYSPKWWRRQCGVVMQEGVIFSESIARNIAVGDGEIDRPRLEQAARIACIEEYILRLPLKYDTRIGPDGIGLSQGQKQRILIARAVYKNPDYIFLDEATNSLDANNERAIVKNLKEFYQGKTVVVVAHRLSTVRDADQIVMMDKGRVVETGTHETLTAARGAYYQLVKNQLELGH